MLGPETPEMLYADKPIVWWLAAICAQWVAYFAVVLIFGVIMQIYDPWIFRSGFVLATIWVANFTWRGGMRRAHSGWQIFTAVMLLINLGAGIIATSGS